MASPSSEVFGTDGIRGRVGQNPITPDFCLKLGWAVGKALVPPNGTVLIGKDTRISGYMLESVLEAGFVSAGVNVGLTGPIPTPAVAYLTRESTADLGVVISGSHNAFDDNGIKFFDADGKKISDEAERSITACLEQTLTSKRSAELGKAHRVVDAASKYEQFCRSGLGSDKPLRGLRIVLDCANGATYRIAPDLFDSLGAEVTAVGVEPDGFNINRECGSTSPGLLQNKVLELEADVGVAFDGDGDRVIMVDASGQTLDGDQLLFAIAKFKNAADTLQGGIVGTQMSNLGLEVALREIGIEFERVAVGDRHVHQRLVQRNWRLGGETSGHLICLDWTTTGDGIISAAHILTELCRSESTLADHVAEFTKYPQCLVNVECADPRLAVASTKVLHALSAVEKELDGCGRVVLRPSGTEPVIRVMVEGEDEDDVNQHAHELANIVAAATRGR